MESLGFNENQWKELFVLFEGILPNIKENILPVRDGIVYKGQNVWWRGSKGPELVSSNDYWEQIKKFPERYQTNKPEARVLYID